MHRPKTTLASSVALAALLGGASACAESGEDNPIAATGDDPVEAAIANLGVAIAGCDKTGFANGTLTLDLAITSPATTSDPLVLSAQGSTFSANGIKCQWTKTTGSGASQVMKVVPLTTSDVTKIIINGTTGPDKVILDFLPGTFGTQVLGLTGGMTVDFADGGADSLMLRAASTAETYKFAYLAGNAAATPATPNHVYIELNGNSTADIDVQQDAAGVTAGTSTLTLTASMGGGNDIVLANAAAATAIDKFSAATIAPVALPSSLGITAYGGLGDDKFTGGSGNDLFYGGDGADTFYASASTDGADVYSGDKDLDTVDYQARTTGDLRIDLGPERPSVEGAADLRETSLYGATGKLKDKTLAFVIDGKRVEHQFSTAPTDPTDLLTILNGAARTALGTTAASPLPVYVSLTAKNHLAITSATNVTATSFVKIEDDPAVTATGGNLPEVDLGLTVAVVSAPTATIGADMTTVTTANLDTKTLILIVDGVYVKLTFDATSSATATSVVTAINNAINAALNTSAVKYAVQDPADNKLKITSKVAVEVKLGTGAYGLPAASVSAAAALGLRSSEQSLTDMSVSGNVSALMGKMMAVVIDGARIEVDYVTTPPAALSNLVSDINAAANTQLRTTSLSYAGVDVTGKKLVIYSGKDLGGASVVRTVGDLTTAAGTVGATGAETPLGLSTLAAANGAKVVGADISAAGLYGALGTLANTRLVLVVNGEYAVHDFAATAGGIADSTALLTAINAAINTAVGTVGATYATKNATTNKLEIVATWIAAKPGLSTATYTYTSAQSVLKMQATQGARRDVFDADDGLFGEFDDVRATTETILSGGGNDVLVGNGYKNTIKGNGGNDTIIGGPSPATCGASDGDTLQGGDGNDLFVSPVANCRASFQGGDGDNVADFSARTAALTLKNDGTANDGETTEVANIATDIKKMIGGFGVDTITGGTADDIIIGGPGADIMTGGAGNDTIDYSGTTGPVTVTLCFTSTIAACTVSPALPDDGASGEHDEIYQIEHVIGSPGDDNLSGLTASATTPLVLEGGLGNDTLTGGSGNDELFGDVGDDKLYGKDGDDRLQGDGGDDLFDGGDSDGDICLTDPQDITFTPTTACEP